MSQQQIESTTTKNDVIRCTKLENNAPVDSSLLQLLEVSEMKNCFFFNRIFDVLSLKRI